MTSQDLPPDVRTVVLVEGDSDRNAILALARRLGRDLADEGIAVVAMGGCHQHLTVRPPVRSLLRPEWSPTRPGWLVRHSPNSAISRLPCERPASAPVAGEVAALSRARFFACDRDLEDEMIRALGTEAMVAFIDSQGEGRTFDLMRRQPAQRERTLEQQIGHRFMGIRIRAQGALWRRPRGGGGHRGHATPPDGPRGDSL